MTSFGGPLAHLGYFREEFVTRRRWLTERGYADLVALCQFLPGPASSQVGMGLGYGRCGYGGALAAWAGFTLPSAVLLVLLALGLGQGGAVVPPGVLHGFKVVAVAVVAQAVWGMARHFCTDTPRIVLMTVAAVVVSWWPSVGGQVSIMGLAAVVGAGWFRARVPVDPEVLPAPGRRRVGLLCLCLLGVLLLALPLAAARFPGTVVAVVDAFFRPGALVFGGGHVVLPLLQAEVVEPGWVTADTFMAGYGAAQAVPGPLFTFAAFLGASLNGALTGWWGALVALLAIFAPSFLLVLGALPFWGRWRHLAWVRAALSGVHAAVVGLLLAALYQPVWTSAIQAPADVALALLALLALMFWRWPVWLVVAACGGAAWLWSVVSLGAGSA